ncbi:MAG: hypothetical protein ACLP5E_27275 [Streptosporangiaceae bacterium]
MPLSSMAPSAGWPSRLLASGCAVARLTSSWIRATPAATDPRPTGQPARDQDR